MRKLKPPHRRLLKSLDEATASKPDWSRAAVEMRSLLKNVTELKRVTDEENGRLTTFGMTAVLRGVGRYMTHMGWGDAADGVEKAAQAMIKRR